MVKEEPSGGISNPAFVSEEPVQGQQDAENGRSQKPSLQMAVVETVDENGERILTPAEKKEKRAIMKNIFIISFAFTFLFTSYNAMLNLQSSLNKSDGTSALTYLYAAFIFSCCFLPSLVIKLLKEKFAMAMCALCYAAYMMAQFYPKLYTLIPTAMLLGLGAGPLWSAKCKYLTKVGTRYAELAGEKSEITITRFFGIFFLFFQSTQIWGNLISSSVLSVGVEIETEINETDLLMCGYDFCIAGSHEDEEGPPMWQIYTMAGVYLACAIISSLILAIFLDPLNIFGEDTEEKSKSKKSTCDLVGATFSHLRHPYQLLLVPITIWSGTEQAFISSDYTAAYVSCGLGVHMVGYVMICYGVCDAFCAYFFTPFVKAYGRVPVFTLGFILNVIVTITLVFWKPHPDDLIWFFVLAALWGIADAVWQTQINALYGVIFPGESEAAFSNYRLWESIGYAIAYACSTALCIEEKIIILAFFLIVGMIGYYIVETMEVFGGLKKDQEGKVIPIDHLISGKY